MEQKFGRYAEVETNIWNWPEVRKTTLGIFDDFLDQFGPKNLIDRLEIRANFGIKLDEFELGKAEAKSQVEEGFSFSLMELPRSVLVRNEFGQVEDGFGRRIEEINNHFYIAVGILRNRNSQNNYRKVLSFFNTLIRERRGVISLRPEKYKDSLQKYANLFVFLDDRLILERGKRAVKVLTQAEWVKEKLSQRREK